MFTVFIKTDVGYYVDQVQSAFYASGNGLSGLILVPCEEEDDRYFISMSKESAFRYLKELYENKTLDLCYSDEVASFLTDEDVIYKDCEMNLVLQNTTKTDFEEKEVKSKKDLMSMVQGVNKKIGV